MRVFKALLLWARLVIHGAHEERTFETGAGLKRRDAGYVCDVRYRHAGDTGFPLFLRVLEARMEFWKPRALERGRRLLLHCWCFGALLTAFLYDAAGEKG